MVALSALTSKIEIDVHGTVFGGTAVWTDITQYAMTSPQEDGSQELQIQWGRQSWLGDVTQGQFGLVLRNSDGRFTPGRASSPYYPYFTFGARVRISETVSGTTVRVADGYVTDITATPRAGVYGTVTVNCADVLARMANMPLRSLLVEEIMLDSPYRLYPFQEPDGSTTFADLTGRGRVATVGNSKHGAGVVQAGQGTSGAFVAGAMVAVTNDTYATSTGSITEVGSWLQPQISDVWPALAGPFAFELWAQIPDVYPGVAGTLLSAQNQGSLALYLFNPAVNSGHNVRAVITDNIGLTAQVDVTANIFDGNMHHFAVSLAANNKTLTLYIDGASVGSATAAAVLNMVTAFSFDPTATLGMQSQAATSFAVPAPATTAPYTGGFAYCAWYLAPLSAARVLAHYNAGAAAFAGESTATHITRLLSYRPDPGANLDAGLGSVGQQDTDGATLAAALTDAASGEGGVLYADGQGRIALLNRGHNFNPAPTVTLDASVGEVDLPSTYVDDTQNVTNDVTVSRPGGADQRAYNQTSVTQLGDLATSTTVNVNTDAQTLDIANWTLAQGIRDQTSIPTLTVNLLSLTTTAQALAVLQLKPLDAVTVTNLPGFPPATSMTVQVQGGTYTRSTETASVELFCAPTPTPVLTTDGLVNGVSVAADTTDSATYVAAY